MFNDMDEANFAKRTIGKGQWVVVKVSQYVGAGIGVPIDAD